MRTDLRVIRHTNGFSQKCKILGVGGTLFVHGMEMGILGSLSSRGDERGVLRLGSIPVARRPTCQDVKTIAL